MSGMSGYVTDIIEELQYEYYAKRGSLPSRIILGTASYSKLAKEGVKSMGTLVKSYNGIPIDVRTDVHIHAIKIAGMNR